MAESCVLDIDVGPLYYYKGKIVPYPRGRDAESRKLRDEFDRLKCATPKKKTKKSLPKETPAKAKSPPVFNKKPLPKPPVRPLPKPPVKNVDKRSPMKSRVVSDLPPAPPSKPGMNKTPKLGKPPARKPPSRPVREDKLAALHKGNEAGNLAAQRRHMKYVNRNK